MGFSLPSDLAAVMNMPSNIGLQNSPIKHQIALNAASIIKRSKCTTHKGKCVTGSITVIIQQVAIRSSDFSESVKGEAQGVVNKDEKLAGALIIPYCFNVRVLHLLSVALDIMQLALWIFIHRQEKIKR